MNDQLLTSSTDAIPEAAAFAAAAADTAADRLTACRGWTAHDLLAHVVAGGAEMLRLVLEHDAGDGPSATTAFAEREAPFRDLDHEVLLDLLTSGGLVTAIDQLDDDASILFTGWSMDRAALLLHVRSELAVHRWDLVGSDDTSMTLLSNPALTAHALRSLTSFDTIAERVEMRTRPIGAPSASVFCLRVPGEPDIVIELDDDTTTLRLAEHGDGPGITTDGAGRLLMLWGRRPSRERHTVETDLDANRLAVLDRWLYG